MDKIKVFVSSTCYDLSFLRENMYNFISTMGFIPILSDFPSFPINPDKITIDNCIENVKNNADIFVLIIGDRYGSVVNDNKSITNLEYLTAKQKGIPIYIFILKKILNILPVWQQNKDGNYENIVDNAKIFLFVDDLKNNHKSWIFDFEKSEHITTTLKTQFSYLFKEALVYRSKIIRANSILDWSQLSPAATKIILEKERLFEINFFKQVLLDELNKKASLKNDYKYNLKLEANRYIQDSQAGRIWFKEKIQTFTNYLKSLDNIVNVAFKEFYAEEGTPSDLKGIYYVACSIAKYFESIIVWSIDIKSVAVDKQFDKLKKYLAKWSNKIIHEIWNYPKKIEKGLKDGLTRLDKGEKNIVVPLTMVMEIDKEISDLISEEIEKLR